MNRPSILPCTIHLGGKILQKNQKMEAGDNGTLPVVGGTFPFAEKADHHHA